MIKILCNVCGCEVKVPHKIKDTTNKKEIDICSKCWTDSHLVYLGEFKKK